MFLLPHHLQQLFKKKAGKRKRAFEANVVGLEISNLENRQITAGQEKLDERTTSQDLEIYPAEPTTRKQWFSLTTRERQVSALLCMGYKNYEIASILGVEYATVQTHLQKIFYKFNLRSRKEIRAALASWPAEEWWRYHHY